MRLRLKSPCFDLLLVVALWPTSAGDFPEHLAAGNALEDRTLEIKKLQRAINKKPEDVVLRQQLGVALESVGRFGEAVEAFKVAYHLEPLKVTGQYLSYALAAVGEFEEALWYFGKASGVKIPFNAKLVQGWRQALDAKSWKPAQPRSSETKWPRAYYVDEKPPSDALRDLEMYLSDRVLGETYNFEFMGVSHRLAPSGSEAGTLMEQAVEHLRKNLPPHIRDAARCAEWWAHRRPNKPTQHGVHSVSLAGHPLHWDNDGAEADGQWPLFTSLLHLTGDTGKLSPTLVMNVSRNGTQLAVTSSAWLVHPAEGRSTFLHGDLLHGVLPSAGTVNVTAFKGAARISLNVAWWPHECRKPKHYDLSQAPPANSRWAQLLASSESPTLWINKPFHDVFCGEDQCGRMAQKSLEL